MISMTFPVLKFCDLMTKRRHLLEPQAGPVAPHRYLWRAMLYPTGLSDSLWAYKEHSCQCEDPPGPDGMK